MDIKLDTELLDDTIAKYQTRERAERHSHEPKYIVIEKTSLKDLTNEVNRLLSTSQYKLNGGISVVANKIMHYRQHDTIEKSYIQSLKRTY